MVGVGEQRVRADLLLVAVAEAVAVGVEIRRAAETGGPGRGGDVGARPPSEPAATSAASVSPSRSVSADSGSVWLIDVS